MLKIEQLRMHQEQRLVPVLESWNEAKSQLEKSIALAESRERDFREVSDDVQRKLDALDLVMGMARELGDETADFALNACENKPVLLLPEKASGETRAPAETSVQIRPTELATRGIGRLLRETSRPLFPNQRTRNSVLSILQ